MPSWIIFSAFIWGITLSSPHFQNAPKYTVKLPAGYSDKNSYPLFIVLHGGNGNMKEMQTRWHSERLDKEYITVYMEASTRDSPGDHWGWRDIPAERMNISGFYNKLVNKFAVDTSRVYAGGFSLGARMSIDLLMTQTLPLKGVISLCHGGGISASCNIDNLEGVKKKKARLVVVDGEKDFTYRKQSEDLQAILEEAGIRYKYVRNPGMGHTIPADFDVQLDALLDTF